MRTHYITWWNVENLNDLEGSEKRPPWLAQKLKRELKGWNDSVLEQKIDNLAKVIGNINDGKGPDLFGLCSVENLRVLELLLQKLSPLNRHYRVLQDVTKDDWGMDLCLVYDAGIYHVQGEHECFEILNREVPINIFKAKFGTGSGNQLTVIANRWPKSEADAFASAAERVVAARKLSSLMDEMQAKNKNAEVVVMGDFVDQPFDRSITHYAQSCISKNKVIFGQSAYLYNLMWPLIGERKGSTVVGPDPSFPDQIMVSRGIVNGEGKFQLATDQAILEDFDFLVTGRYDLPIRFGRPSSTGSYNPSGFSDHLPISVILNEV